MTPEQARDALVFALDAESTDKARRWVDRLSGTARRIKVGASMMTIHTSGGLAMMVAAAGGTAVEMILAEMSGDP